MNTYKVVEIPFNFIGNKSFNQIKIDLVKISNFISSQSY